MTSTNRATERDASVAENPSVIPYIAIVETDAVITLVENAFDGKGSVQGTGSQGGIHAEYKIGDAMLMIGGGPSWRDPKPRPAALHLYVADCDRTYARALEAGATSTHAPVDQPYGDREASVKDAAGNSWYIAQLRDRERPEGLRDLTLYFHPRGTAAFIEFLKKAFDATTALIDQSSAGIIHHAQVKIGNTFVEMGEAHGPWQPMPTAIFLNVPQCDATFAKAIAAGGKSEGDPADMPFGFRVGTIRDEQGNAWYLSSKL